MTSFKVFQIHLSYLQYTILAEGKFPVPKEQWRKRIQVAMDEDAQSIDKYVSHALEEGFYDHVADIEATDLHDVFRVGNVGPEEAITRHAQMHSISVGAKFTRKMSDGPEVMEEDEYTKLTHAERAFVDAAKALVDLSKVIDPDLLLAWTATGAGGMKHDVDRRMVAIVAAARGEEERVPGVFVNKLDPPKSEPEVATSAELSAEIDEIEEIRARLEKKLGRKI